MGLTPVKHENDQKKKPLAVIKIKSIKGNFLNYKKRGILGSTLKYLES